MLHNREPYIYLLMLGLIMLVMDWTPQEQQIAQQAFNRAYNREIAALTDLVRERAKSVTSIQDIWQLHDFLSARRHEIDGKYDYNYPSLMFVFAKLIKDGWLALEELEGLGSDKLAKIRALTRM
jgi:hypothetical protein